MNLNQRELAELRSLAPAWAARMDRDHGPRALSKLDRAIADSRQGLYPRMAALATRRALLDLYEERTTASARQLAIYHAHETALSSIRAYLRFRFGRRKKRQASS
jgi:hypothetical protein